MIRPIYKETNDMVSMSVFNDPQNGVQSQLVQQNENLSYNNASIEDCKDFAFMRGHDNLDNIAIAASHLAEKTQAYNKSAFKSAFVNSLQNVKKK